MSPSRARAVLAVAIAVAAGIAAAGPAAASPLELFGFGGRSPALAETGVASADDFDCVYLNPAGLAEVSGRRLSLGTLYGRFALDGVDRPVDDAVGVEVGGAFRLPLGGALRDRVGFAIGLYVPTTLLNRARAPVPGTPFFAVLENRSQVIGVQLGLGVRVSDELALGAGVLALAALRGHIDVTPDAAGRFLTNSEEQLTAAFAPVFGARYRLGPDWVLGATLHFASQSTYDIHITNNLGAALPVTLPELRVAGTAQYDPLIAAVEGSYRLLPELLLSLQLSYERWSAFPLPTENVVDLMPAQPPTNFHDTVVPRLAAEWSVGHGVSVRGGYSYVMSPAPDSISTGQAFLDNDRHVLSLGLGVVAAPLHVDAWAQAHLLPSRQQRPDLVTSGNILVGGVVLGVDL
jgi:long-chain fatty acid transport protein